MTYIAFGIVDPAGEIVAEYANFHEARSHAAEYGTGFTVRTLHHEIHHA